MLFYSRPELNLKLFGSDAEYRIAYFIVLIDSRTRIAMAEELLDQVREIAEGQIVRLRSPQPLISIGSLPAN